MKKSRLKILLIVLGLVLLAAINLVLILLDLDTLYYITIGWVVLVVVLLWVGNSFISGKLDKSFPWLEYGNLRFFTQLLATLVYSLLIINISYFLFKYLFTVDPPTLMQIIVMNVYGIFIILPVVSIYFGVHFLRSWRKSEVEAEKFHKESMKSQLEALKNHLDPHFLFNNLNILSSLIDKDKELSKAYLDKFAEVYRVILQSNVTEPIPLTKELDFVKAYMYLINIRFEENIKLEIDIDKQLEQRVLPPLTLQMLVENAIKHNIVTENKPLNISIKSDRNNFLMVVNNLQKRNQLPNNHGSGLKNIQNRYSYFTEKKVITEIKNGLFIVKVPLIQVEEI